MGFIETFLLVLIIVSLSTFVVGLAKSMIESLLLLLETHLHKWVIVIISIFIATLLFSLGVTIEGGS